MILSPSCRVAISFGCREFDERPFVCSVIHKGLHLRERSGQSHPAVVSGFDSQKAILLLPQASRRGGEQDISVSACPWCALV